MKACVMRNPVTDIVGMAPTTDIPDWYYNYYFIIINV